MQRLAALSLSVAPLLLSAASAPVASGAVTADSALVRARAEAADAAKRLATLEAKAEKAGSEAARLRADRLAAAAAIEASEAEISASNAALRLARTRVLLAEQRLAKRRAPLAALLAGLATMGRQPPLMTLADHGSVDEMVRVRALLDATMPVIEARSAALTAELSERRNLASAADWARQKLERNRDQLAVRRLRFAELEAKAIARAARAQGEAFGAGERVLASGELLSAAGSDAAERRASRASAAALSQLEFAPARPGSGNSRPVAAPIAYTLPVIAPLTEGLGSVNRAGIASRGLRLEFGAGCENIGARRRHHRLRRAVSRRRRSGDHRPWWRLDQPFARRRK